MRFSVATKIFLGFAAVIIAFGATSAFTLYRMGSLRRAMTVLWNDLTPMSNQLRAFSRQLKSAEELLALRRPNDAQWLQQVLPALEPFGDAQGFQSIAARLQTIAASDAVSDAEERDLAALAGALRAFASGKELAETTPREDLSEAPLDATLDNAQFYDHLVRRTLKQASLGTLHADSPEARASARVLRRINREVNEAIRQLAGPIRALDQRTDEDERSSTLTVVIIASGALLLSIVMLVVAQLTLRPIRALREGAQKIAAGHYDERVTVSSKDEIGQLAVEFNTMAERLDARDRALAQKQTELIRAERLAVIGKLAAQITHEVRNPLSSIGLNAEMLEDELAGLPDPADRDRTRASLQAISAEVARLKAITEEYLQYARLPRPELVSVDVGALLEQFLSFLAREVEEARVTLRVEGVIPHAAGGPAPITADPAQLRQAILNVARNALEALRTVPEPRTLTVALAPRFAPGGAPDGVILRIEDSGPGIDAAVKDRLFEPFVTGKPHGTGLGLALVKEIVQEHGGRVSASSPVRDGRGTAVILELPQAPTPVLRGSATAAPANEAPAS